jgi:hypothetical protein
MRATSWISETLERRGWIFFALAAALQLTFTVCVRLFVVPVLTPGRHWLIGLQRDTDSHFFFLQAVQFRRFLDARGWAGLQEPLPEGQTHIKIMAGTFYLQGANSPWLMYACNTLLFVLTLWLLVELQRLAGVPRTRARLVSLMLGASPMLLFSYSELLREPFIVPFALLFAVGLGRIAVSPEGTKLWRGLLVGAVAVWFGFVGLSTFRPYLMLLAIAGLGASAVVLLVLAIFTAPAERTRRLAPPAVLLLLAALLVVLMLRPQGQVQAYREAAVNASEAEAEAVKLRAEVQEELARMSAQTGDPSSRQGQPAEPSTVGGAPRASGNLPRVADRKLFLKGRGCSVPWQRTAWVPEGLDRKVEALACVRDEFQTYCDQSIYGPYADRNCDGAVLASVPAVITHQPRSLWYALWTPYPSMWFSSFGAGGTGLRRVGYVFDGVLSYVCLIGLLLGLRQRPTNAVYLAVTAALLTVLTVYATAIPSQFIFMRMRLGLYLPLLALGGAQIARLLTERAQRMPVVAPASHSAS